MHTCIHPYKVDVSAAASELSATSAAKSEAKSEALTFGPVGGKAAVRAAAKAARLEAEAMKARLKAAHINVAGVHQDTTLGPREALPVHPYPNASLTDQHLQLGMAAAELAPKHLLVCTPSNAAIDEIVSRLLQHAHGGGMLNSKGEPFIPSIVRVGPGVRESLRDVGLESLARLGLGLGLGLGFRG